MTTTANPSELERRITQLEQELAHEHERFVQVQETNTFQKTMLDMIPALVYLKDREHRYQFANRTFIEHTIVTDSEIQGKSDHELFAEDVADAYHEDDERIMLSGQASIGVELPITQPNGQPGWVSNSAIPYRDADGRVIGLLGIAIDITGRRQAEDALRHSEAEQRELLNEQMRLLDTIRELASPVLPVLPEVLILPLVGHIDARRSQQIMETLLQGIQEHQATLVIIDITGVPVVDTAIASHLLQMTRAAQLIGTQCMLVGISAEIAQTMVSLGIDLNRLLVYSNLEAAIAYAMRHAHVS